MEWDAVLIKFAQLMLEILLPVIAAALAGLVIQGVKYLTAKLKESQPHVYEVISWLAAEAVHAAEQAGLGGLITDKKKFAIEYLQRELDARGLVGFDVALLADKIEAAVWEEINKDKAMF